MLKYNLHSSYNQTKYIGEEEIIYNLFSTYVEPLLNYINHPALVQEWKLNIDAPDYEKNDPNVNIPSDKNKLIIMIEKRAGQSAYKKEFSGLLFTLLWIILQVSLKQIYH